MIKKQPAFLQEISTDSWAEELARAKKYKEATQKRRTEKLASKQIEDLKKGAQVGRLKIEP